MRMPYKVVSSFQCKGDVDDSWLLITAAMTTAQHTFSCHWTVPFESGTEATAAQI